MPQLTVLGGGVTGLGVAFHAHRAGLPFTVFERSPQMGGLCRTLQCGAHRYDCGAHRFHDRHAEITAEVRDLLKGHLHTVTTSSMIFDRGRLLDFPPTPLNFIRGAGADETCRVVRDLLVGRLRRKPPITFADVSIRNFGKTLARRFLLDYSEKVWGLPGEELSPDVSTRRLSGMTLRTLLVELLDPEGKTSHIDGCFLYPEGGFGKIVEALEDSVPQGCLRREQEVTGLEVKNGAVTRLRFKDRAPVDSPGRIVSTIPLTTLVDCLGKALPEDAIEAARGLRFRSIRLFFLRLNVPSFSANASLYFPDPRLCFSRLSEPKNRCARMAPENETSLLVEVPCFERDGIWELTAATLLERVLSDLETTGLFKRSVLLDWEHHLLSHAYPVYRLDYRQRVKTILDNLAVIRNLDILGRGGLFYYSHLHEQLKMAKDYINRATGDYDRVNQRFEEANRRGGPLVHPPQLCGQ